MMEDTISESGFLALLRSHIAVAQGVEDDEIVVEMSSSLRDDLDVDSLTSIELTMAIEEQYDIELEDADVFESATVGDLFQIVRGAKR